MPGGIEMQKSKLTLPREELLAECRKILDGFPDEHPEREKIKIQIRELNDIRHSHFNSDSRISGYPRLFTRGSLERTETREAGRAIINNEGGEDDKDKNSD